MRVFIRPRGGEYVSIGFHPVCTLRGFGCLSNTVHWALASLLIPTKVLVGFCFLGSVCGHEPQHLLFQLRIYLVCNRHNVRKQCAEFQSLHVLV
jgi:hypothetical protein